MKTRIKNLLLLLLLLGSPGVVQAQNAYSTNADGSIYTYSTNADGSANIVAYAGPPWVVTIPTNINGLTVTSIGTNAFYYDTSLISVTIPDGVAGIGRAAFLGCQNLTDVTIGSGLTSIGDYAFEVCINLSAITVAAQNPVYMSVNGILFNKSQSTLVLFPAGQSGAYIIPDSVTNISIAAFFESSLINVTIGSNVTSIGTNAFSGCQNLTSVTIPNSVISLEANAFQACLNLTKVTIGNSVTKIGLAAFSLCPLTEVTIPNSVTSIGEGAFFQCFSLTSVYFTGNARIGGDAFFQCFSLTSVYFTGNAPSPTNDSSVFNGDPATVYYLPGTTGWGALFDGLPTAPWFLPNPLILNHGPGFGIQPGGFGFTISWATNASIVVLAATNLANPIWIPVSTTPLTNGTSYFSDPQWTNYPNRFYRITSTPTFPGITGNLDVDMYNAAVADGTANGGVPAVMGTENGGPFRVTAAGRVSNAVCRAYFASCVFTHVVGTYSCSSTTLPSGTPVIQFGTVLECGVGPYRY